MSTGGDRGGRPVTTKVASSIFTTVSARFARTPLRPLPFSVSEFDPSTLNSDRKRSKMIPPPSAKLDGLLNRRDHRGGVPQPRPPPFSVPWTPVRGGLWIRTENDPKWSPPPAAKLDGLLNRRDHGGGLPPPRPPPFSVSEFDPATLNSDWKRRKMIPPPPAAKLDTLLNRRDHGGGLPPPRPPPFSVSEFDPATLNSGRNRMLRRREGLDMGWKNNWVTSGDVLKCSRCRPRVWGQNVSAVGGAG